ncbi:GGDEF domain-containing protein [Pseudohaliea rubra]|uniref:diguanylate cyclase n=1 Tax=Pseudohaliea rubra DSM 19751 TaxID=1265313 RepID=A0A095X1E6_9GAMM|nr:GGDEF domain-containing protein [Pseudohaliea rubra]KGE04684.1 hypothetical protein HRUBRA_00709 [Pseudohaliea rubra DSM 19751]
MTDYAVGAATEIRLARQASLLRAMLLLAACYGFVTGLTNFFVFSRPLIAAIDGLVLAGAVLSWLLLRQARLLWPVSLAVLTFYGLLLLFYFIASEARNYSLVWAAVLPPLAFFLLGSRGGTLFSALFSLLVLALFAMSYRQAPVMPLELPALLNLGAVLVAHCIIFRFSERSRELAYAELARLSQYDELTGLLNRRQFDAELRQHMALARRRGSSTAVLLVDLDHFKHINDRHGHLVGDRVLVEAGQCISAVVRATDSVGRWGGEEFVIVCPDTELSGASQVAEKVRRSLERSPLGDGVQLSASVGVAVDRSEESVESLLARADGALYRAKEQGRNRVVLEEVMETPVPAC